MYTDISYYWKLKEPTEVMEYRYLPFDRGERDYQNKIHTKKKHKKK
jgi:hypothetical protein